MAEIAVLTEGENGYRKIDEPDDLADELDLIARAVEHCERRNQHEVKEEIRVFTQRHHISQTAISKATHQAISQSYISQWLTSNITMGDAKRRIIYEWFVRQKRRLEGVYPGAAHINNTINPKTIVSTSAPLAALPSSLQSRLMSHLPGAVSNIVNGLPHSIDRNSPGIISPIPNRKPRQRIMWPMKCLQFLDGAFSRNPYPGAAERTQLVVECNNLLGEDRSVDINEAHVANWFRNRRKMKKVIDQSGGNKSMEHFEELIEMQEGSNDGVDDTPQGEKTAQPGEILDIEEVNGDEEHVKVEPKSPLSPAALRIDSPIDESSPSGESRKSPITSLSEMTSGSISQNGSNSQTTPTSQAMLKSALLSNTHLDSGMMQRIMNNAPPSLTPAPGHLLHSSLMSEKPKVSFPVNL